MSMDLHKKITELELKAESLEAEVEDLRNHLLFAFGMIYDGPATEYSKANALKKIADVLGLDNPSVMVAAEIRSLAARAL